MRLIIMLLLIPSALAISDTFEVEQIDVDARWDAVLTSTTGPSPRLSSLEARVNLVPPEYTTIPSSTHENESIVFRWTTLKPRYEYAVLTSTTLTQTGGLSRSEAWPTRAEGLVETKLIDYNHPSVRAFAAQIGDGETDTLRLAVRAADAVRERITYNLSTINIEASFPASDVLARGEGVCDEISVLYIATMRALGVPARYVSGYALTDIFEPSGTWEAHGWSEVLIGTEWVPFDLTYNEYIHLSAPRIRLRASDDAESTRVSYSWIGRDVQIDAERIRTTIDITREEGRIRFGEIDARFVHDTVGPGWNELEITITNEYDSFIAPIVALSRTQGLETPSEASIIVPPNGQRSIRLPVRITEELRPRYEYTFPVSVNARGFEPASASFRASNRYASIDEPQREREEESHPDMRLECSNALAYPESEAQSTCTMTNTGNRNLNVNVCGERCVPVTILIGETVTTDVPVRTRTGEAPETISIQGSITSETTITVTGREPARVSLETESQGRDVTISIRSDHPIEGHATLAVNDYETLGTGHHTVPSHAFGLRADARITYEYTDVDGRHVLEETVRVTQNPIEWLTTRVRAWLTPPQDQD